jgi:hypothetical protein
VGLNLGFVDSLERRSADPWLNELPQFLRDSLVPWVKQVDRVDEHLIDQMVAPLSTEPRNRRVMAIE